MSWITASGETETHQSNLLPEDAPRGPNIETSMHGEVIHRNGKSTYIDHKGAGEEQMDKGIITENGILGSARAEGGHLIHGRNVIASDQVTLPGGMPTRVSVAADLGYLQRNPDGSYSDVTTAPESESDRGDQNDAPEGFGVTDEAHTAFTKLVDTVDQGSNIAALSEILQLGETSETTLARIATSQGIEPEQAAEMINTVHAGYYEAASDHMEGLGITNGDAFQAFVQDNPHAYEKLAEGARELVMSHETAGLDDVASQFMEQADRYMQEDVVEALDAAGFDHIPDGKGGLIVITNDGAQVSFQVAVKMGIVKFSRS